MSTLEGKLVANNMKVGIVVARFNEFITNKLLGGAMAVSYTHLARVPFSLDIPDKLATRDSITQAEFDTMMQTGLAQAKRIDAVSVDEAFNQLKAEI